jgi:hypothetical protein
VCFFSHFQKYRIDPVGLVMMLNCAPDLYQVLARKPSTPVFFRPSTQEVYRLMRV